MTVEPVGEIEGTTIPVPIVGGLADCCCNTKLESSFGLVHDAVSFLISGHADQCTLKPLERK